MSVPLPVPAAAPVPLVAPGAVVAVVPPEAARGMGRGGVAVDPQEWALVQRGNRTHLHQRRAASSNAVAVPANNNNTHLSNNNHQHSTETASPTVILRHFASTESISGSESGDALYPSSPDSDTNVQIFEYLRTNCRTEEYVDKIVPSIVKDPRRLKDMPELSRTLTRLPEGSAPEKDILEDLGHKSVLDEEEADEDAAEAARRAACKASSVVSLPVHLLRYLDESRCTTPHPPRRRLSSLSLSSLSSLSHRLPLPRHLRQLTVKNIKLSLGKLCRRRTVVITESDPTYKVAYLGNVLTGWAKGEGCAEKPLSTLWKNYTSSSKPDVNMKVAVTRSGLKATTREHGLTEYWSHRITHCAAPPAFPRVFCWVYRHEGRKLKQELRCHAVLCAREDQARRMAQQLTERLALALLEFRRDKQCREQARLSLANALHDNPSLPQRKLLLSTGASNYRPPLERSKSAPKLGSIEEAAEEDEAGDVLVFGHPRTVARFLRDERLASVRRQRFRDSLRRKIANRLAEEAEDALPEDVMREDPRREVLTVVRVNSIEEEPDPEPAPPEERAAPVPLQALQQQLVGPSAAGAAAPSPASPAAVQARVQALSLLDGEDAGDAVESDEGSSSLQSISSDGAMSATLSHSHSRTDSGEDFCLGADASKTSRLHLHGHLHHRHDPHEDDGLVVSWEGGAVDGERDDFDDNVSDESGYVEAPSEALLRCHGLSQGLGGLGHGLGQDKARPKACVAPASVPAASLPILASARPLRPALRQGLQV